MVDHLNVPRHIIQNYRLKQFGMALIVGLMLYGCGNEAEHTQFAELCKTSQFIIKDQKLWNDYIAALGRQDDRNPERKGKPRRKYVNMNIAGVDNYDVDIYQFPYIINKYHTSNYVKIVQVNNSVFAIFLSYSQGKRDIFGTQVPYDCESEPYIFLLQQFRR